MPVSQTEQQRCIFRKRVEADSGLLRVKHMPGIGCILTIDLPR